MNKEEILEKSRKEKSDEGLIAAENQGRKIGIGVFCGVFVFIILFNIFLRSTELCTDGNVLGFSCC